MNQIEFIKNLPKAELHVHLEGTISPNMLLELAEHNKVKLPYNHIDDIKKAYNFSNYDEFSQSYQIVTNVLKTEQNFYDVAYAYAKRVFDQGVKHLEITFDLDTYLPRGINESRIINGIHNALSDANKEFGITSGMILCFLRHLPEKVALNTLRLSLPFKDKIIAIGLASFEKDNPPSKFKNVFKAAKDAGYYLTAHVGENAGPENIWQAIEILGIERIDHGVRCVEDLDLIKFLRDKQLPLTVCPISNIKTGIFKNLNEHPIKKMLDAKLLVSINSDDPVFFGGELIDNYLQVMKDLNLSNDDLVTSARNSFKSAFLANDIKKMHLANLDDYLNTYKHTINL